MPQLQKQYFLFSLDLVLGGMKSRGMMVGGNVDSVGRSAGLDGIGWDLSGRVGIRPCPRCGI